MGHNRRRRSLAQVTSWKERSSVEIYQRRTKASVEGRARTAVQIHAAPRPPYKLLDSLASTFKPRHWLGSISTLHLLSSPDAQPMIAPLGKGEDALAEGKEASAPDGGRRLYGEEGCRRVVEVPGLCGGLSA